MIYGNFDLQDFEKNLNCFTFHDSKVAVRAERNDVKNERLFWRTP
jgi:hypothetical protein